MGKRKRKSAPAAPPRPGTPIQNQVPPISDRQPIPSEGPAPSASASGEPTPSATTESGSKGNTATLLSVMVTIFVAALGLGYLFGKHNSPDYDDPRKAEGLILRWMFDRVSLNETAWKIDGNMSSSGRVTLRLINATLQFNCAAILEHDLSTGASLPTKHGEVVYCSAPSSILDAYERDSISSMGSRPYAISDVPELIRGARHKCG